MKKRISIFILVATLMISSLNVLAGSTNRSLGDGALATLNANLSSVVAMTTGSPAGTEYIRTVVYGNYGSTANSSVTSASGGTYAAVTPPTSTFYRGASSHQSGVYYEYLDVYV